MFVPTLPGLTNLASPVTAFVPVSCAFWEPLKQLLLNVTPLDS
jgi:hypothetical protein